MNPEDIRRYGHMLYQAMQSRQSVRPLTEQAPDISIDDAYQISLQFLQHRLDAGERIVGKKIGLTSHAVQHMLGVDQPDFGYLTDKMVYSQGQEIDVGQSMIQPRAEGEIAFILKKDLMGPGIRAADVLAATACVLPCFEIVY